MFEMGAKLGDGWSVDKVCPKCGENVSECRCGKDQSETLAPEKHLLVFKFEKRNGRPVTLVGPFSLEEKVLKELLKKVKKKLGAGGSLEEEWMAVQGDVKEKIRTVLEQESYRFKRK